MSMAPPIMGARSGAACLAITIGMTFLATVFHIVLITSDSWEIISYSHKAVDRILLEKHGTEWQSQSLFDDRVLVVYNFNGSDVISSSSDNNDNMTQEMSLASSNVREILIQMRAGLWRVCFDLTDEEISIVEAISPNATADNCLDQMTEQKAYIEAEPKKAAKSRQIRMQNLSTACALVSMIILTACLLLFWIGLLVPIVPPILVTSVLYLLAAVFGIFSLTIAKHRRESVGDEDGVEEVTREKSFNYDPVLDDKIEDIFLPTRKYEQAWAVYIGWVGIGFCFASAICVYGLSKLMRGPPIFF